MRPERIAMGTEKTEKKKCSDCYYYQDYACLCAESPNCNKIRIFGRACEYFRIHAHTEPKPESKDEKE